MIISREYLLDLAEKPRWSVSFHSECIVRDVELTAEEGGTTYISQPFSREQYDRLVELLYELCQIFPDVHIFTMKNAKSGDRYLIIDWTTKYKFSYNTD